MKQYRKMEGIGKWSLTNSLVTTKTPKVKGEKMKNIFLVAEYYNNGESYEEQENYVSIIHGFPTKEEAEEFIKELDIPTADYPEQEKYFEVFKGDEIFKYCSALGTQFRRYFLHRVNEGRNGCRVYETLAYFIIKIPFGKEG